MITTFSKTSFDDRLAFSNGEGVIRFRKRPFVRGLDKNWQINPEHRPRIFYTIEKGDGSHIEDTPRHKYVTNFVGMSPEQIEKRVPVIASGLAALLIRDAVYITGRGWKIGTNLAAYRRQAEQGFKFDDKELAQHQEAERSRFERELKTIKAHLPVDLFDAIHVIVETYCSTRIIDPASRDVEILKFFGNDVELYDRFYLECEMASSLNQMGNIVDKVLEWNKGVYINGKRLWKTDFIRQMQDSGKFRLLNNGRDFEANYKAMVNH